MLQQNERSLFFLALTFSVFILRMALPFTLYLLIFCLVATIFSSYKSILENIKAFSFRNYKLFIPFLLTIICFMLPVLLVGPNKNLVLKELMNVPLVMLIMYLFIVIVPNAAVLNKFITLFARLYCIIVLVVSCMAAIKFWLLLKGIQLGFLINHEKYPWGFSLSSDYNFYTVAIFLAFLLMLWYRFEIFPKKWNLLNYLGFALITCNIFYSGSRRGLMLLFVIIVFQCIYSLIRFKKLKAFKEKIIMPLIGILVLVSQLYFLYFSSYEVREFSGKAIGVFGKPYKKEVTAIAFRYLTLINPEVVYKVMYRDMWPKKDGDLSKAATPELPYDKTTYGSRTERWKFGFAMFKNEYTWPQKLIGHGFYYLHRFAINFRVINYNPYDYPHSPIISALLYSGLIGVIILLVYFGFSFYYIFALKLFHPVFLIFYGLVGFFSMLSGNSYFSIPIFVLATLVPYYLAYLHRFADFKQEVK
jgi:hypothetical protein